MAVIDKLIESGADIEISKDSVSEDEKETKDNIETNAYPFFPQSASSNDSTQLYCKWR